MTSSPLQPQPQQPDRSPPRPAADRLTPSPAETPKRPADTGQRTTADQHQQDLVDEASEESFPASDPPSYPGTTA